MIRITQLLLPALLLLQIACSSDTQQQETEIVNDSLQEAAAIPDSMPAVSNSGKQAPSRHTGRKLSQAEKERMLDEIGFQLEELKGREAELEGKIASLKRKKSNPEREKEIQGAEKELVQVKKETSKLLARLQGIQAR